MSNDVIIITTTRGQTESVKSFLSDRNLKFPVYAATMQDAVLAAKEEINKGAKVVVSRGTTASYLREHVSVPVVDIRHNVVDIFLAVEKAKKYSDKIAVVGGERLCKTAEIFSKISGFILLIRLAETVEDFERELAYVAKEGIEVALGGFQVEKLASRYKLKYVTSPADSDAIHEAIQEALHDVRVIKAKKEEYETINAILNNVSEGIIGFKSDGSLIHINNIAKKMLKYKEGKLITDLLPEGLFLDTVITGDSHFGELVTIDNQCVLLNTVPIIVDAEVIGAVTTLHKEKIISQMDISIRKKHLTRGHVAKKRFLDIIGHSAVIEAVKKKAKLYAKSEGTVLISGETGTGKELFAQSIHNFSKRNDFPFVAINCAALSENVLESELFGYVKGAFTGARSEGKEGLFEMAHNGTIFLDEISEIPNNVQVKLLRVIQEKEVCRLGDDKIIPINVRVIAASNKNIPQEVEKGTFREDLYYRLSVLELMIPPLRDRRADIYDIVDYLLEEIIGNDKTITKAAKDILSKYDWPGNVRQLSNVIRCLIVISDEEKYIDEDKVLEVLSHKTALSKKEISVQNVFDRSTLELGLVQRSQKELIKMALTKTYGSRKKTAEILGMGTTTLWRKIKQLNLADFAENVKKNNFTVEDC
jgi:transcriptional regulator with PAS, ATPase and Fis domain